VLLLDVVAPKNICGGDVEEDILGELNLEYVYSDSCNWVPSHIFEAGGIFSRDYGYTPRSYPENLLSFQRLVVGRKKFLGLLFYSHSRSAGKYCYVFPSKIAFKRGFVIFNVDEMANVLHFIDKITEDLNNSLYRVLRKIGRLTTLDNSVLEFIQRTLALLNIPTGYPHKKAHFAIFARRVEFLRGIFSRISMIRSKFTDPILFGIGYLYHSEDKFFHWLLHVKQIRWLIFMHTETQGANLEMLFLVRTLMDLDRLLLRLERVAYRGEPIANIIPRIPMVVEAE